MKTEKSNVSAVAVRENPSLTWQGHAATLLGSAHYKASSVKRV
jgi:hypothetical protein